MINTLSTTGWQDYELIDSGNGFRLERFGKYVLQRPDPQIIWKRKLSQDVWNKADAIFQRTTEDKGQWIKNNKNLPEKWLMEYNNLKFWVKLFPFKHTGVFPEQCLQWDFITNAINSRVITTILPHPTPLPVGEGTQKKPPLLLGEGGGEGQVNILNLFAYTGIASLAAAAAGAKVTHVDASKPTIGWARENQSASGLEQKPIRWILDDAVKFTQREINRGIKYDGIILDPPAFGHGPDGSVWKFNHDFPKLLELCKQVLSDTPLFVIVNAYAISSSSIMLKNVLADILGEGQIESGELCLEEKANHRLLSTGLFARWSTK